MHILSAVASGFLNFAFGNPLPPVYGFLWLPQPLVDTFAKVNNNMSIPDALCFAHWVKLSYQGSHRMLACLLLARTPCSTLDPKWVRCC